MHQWSSLNFSPSYIIEQVMRIQKKYEIVCTNIDMPNKKGNASHMRYDITFKFNDTFDDYIRSAT
ncbi:hypothetical protein B4W72_06710 [Staphylococcus delphini]|uniref:Uncharacterized protein n=1 Tax=Staphylococcus delphini TaxID=53344 RepID=A0A2A4GYH4_9STAP|nr:hypothetical protein B5C08_04705 [Staphylococcus delphini]PCF63499.1 hypothetical protein B5C01_01220 [Staphylococcus delphini]PCF72999.1 hypothetical protein B4W72_06710 [Staphylococcus delphini]